MKDQPFRFFYKTTTIIYVESQKPDHRVGIDNPHSTPRSHNNNATFFFEHPEIEEIKEIELKDDKEAKKKWCNIL